MKNKSRKQEEEKKTKGSSLRYDVHDTPPIGSWILLSFQHVFAMFGATILVPIIINGAVGVELIPIPVALVASGVGTLVYILCAKRKSPIYQGSSFAFISPIIAGYFVAGAAGVYTALITVGLVYVAVAMIIKFVGKEWINTLLPAVIIGPMIMIIGLGLAYVAVNMIGINADVELEWQNVVVALVTFLVTASVALYAKGFFKVIPFLTGIIVGYAVAACLGMVDFTAFHEASFFAVPNFQFIFHNWSFEFGALLTIVPVALVTICEHIGDHKVIGKIIEKDLIKDPGLDNTLMGDGLATIASASLGGPASTSYGENIGVIGITKVASVKVLMGAALAAMCIGFLGKFTALVGGIPSPVLGGVSLILFGFIAVSGLRVLIDNKVDFTSTKNVIVEATMLVLGLGGAVISFVYGDFSLSISGMALAAIVGVVLNLCLPEEKTD
jgi:uracil permease